MALTLGKQGTLVFDGANMQLVETIAVNTVDTTGAGDAFAGALKTPAGRKRHRADDVAVKLIGLVAVAGVLD